MLEERLAQLTGGIGVIRVGAYTDTEFNAKKYKFENAINATQAALQEGILPGGGTALAIVSRSVSEPMFKNALTAPLEQMAMNAGMYKKSWLFGTPNVNWLVKQVQSQTTTDVIGYDFKKKRLTNMFECGIIDPFKVQRLALESAVAITKAVIGMETAIVVVDDEN